MVEYEIYVPLSYNDGRPVEPEKLRRLKGILVDAFGGLTHFPQENEGVWKMGSHTFRDRIVIFRMLAADRAKSERTLSEIKEWMRSDWQQEDVLIIGREVRPL